MDVAARTDQSTGGVSSLFKRGSKATPHFNMIGEGIGSERGKECYGFQMFSLTLMSVYNDKRVNSLKTYTGM